ncbi:hypothetical protein [Nostoc phage NMeng1]|nr:hypothetical protein [Nostoc phage NMeng1]
MTTYKHTKDIEVPSWIESTFSYIVALVSIFFGYILDAAPSIAAIGGLVLLLLRLYVDGKRAVKTWKGQD